MARRVAACIVALLTILYVGGCLMKADRLTSSPQSLPAPSAVSPPLCGDPISVGFDPIPVSVYIHSWREAGLTPMSVDTVLLAFAEPDVTGRLKFEATPVSLKYARSAKHVVLSVGGWGETNADNKRMKSGFTAAANNPTLFMSSLKRVIADLAMQNVKVAGISIDWEHPDEPGQFSRLIKAIKLAMPGYALSAAVTPVPDEHAYDNVAFNYLDSIHVMTYDMHGPWGENIAGPLSSAAYIRDGVAKWVKFTRQYPMLRIEPGVPGYGYRFVGSRNAGQPAARVEELATWEEVEAEVITRGSVNSGLNTAGDYVGFLCPQVAGRAVRDVVAAHPNRVTSAFVWGGDPERYIRETGLLGR